MRIRSIKPEFWTSEDIACLDWPTRLLFIGLWSYVDDNGVGRDNDKLIKADLFPLEDDPRETLATVSRGLQQLAAGGQITRYSHSGRDYLCINAWEDHQRIDRPNKARYPALTSENVVIRDTLATPSRVSRETPATGAGEQRNRGTGEQGRTTSSDKSDKTDAPPALFEDFWNTYGKKVGRAKAITAYKAAIKKPGVTPSLLIAAAAQYVEWCRSEDKFPDYTKDPTTWLHGEHWNDERAARPAPKSRVGEHLTLVQQLRAEEEAENQRQIGHNR